MSAGEIQYTVRVAYPDYLQRARAQVASLALYLAGVLAAPTALGSTFALYDPSGNAVVAPAAITVTGSVATYPILAASLPATLSLGHGYREEWVLVCADGVTRTFRRDAAIVLYAAYPVVTDADLTAVYSDLTRQLKPGTTSFVLYIDEAWKRILGRLEGQGVFPDHVVTDWSLREVHAELSLYLVCLDLARSQGGRWLDLANQHKAEFERAWSRLRFVMTTSPDGNVDGVGVNGVVGAAAKGVTFVNASPRVSWRGFGGL